MKFRVLNITNNIKEYKYCKKDTLEFPELVEEVEDEEACFIYCEDTGEHWLSEEFFYSVTIKTFESNDVSF